NRFRRLYEPLGEWRTQWLWRGYGVCLLDFLASTYAKAGLAAMLAPPERMFIALGACGVLLAATGPRLITLALTFVCSLVCFGITVSEISVLTSFPGAEWTMSLLMPLFSCAVV